MFFMYLIKQSLFDCCIIFVLDFMFDIEIQISDLNEIGKVFGNLHIIYKTHFNNHPMNTSILYDYIIVADK